MPKGEVTETANTVRVVLTNREFDEYRVMRLASGIKMLLGVVGGKSYPATIIFDKEKYTVDQAKAWVDKHHSKFVDAIVKEKEKVALFDDEEVPVNIVEKDVVQGDGKMTEVSVESNVSVFSEDQMGVLKNCVAALESADSLDKVKEIVVTLKAILPVESQPEKVVESTVEVVEPAPTTEPVPEDAPVEPAVPEKPVETAADQKSEVDVLEQLKATYQLNDKLITTLKEMESQIEAKDTLIKSYEQEVTALKDSIVSKEQEVEAFRQAESARVIAQFESQKKALVNEWCNVLDIQDRTSVEKMFSAFKSEDALNDVRKQLEQKKAEVFVKKKEEVELRPVTVASEVLRETPENMVTFERYQAMSPDEKTNYLFEKMCESKKKKGR